MSGSRQYGNPPDLHAGFTTLEQRIPNRELLTRFQVRWFEILHCLAPALAAYRQQHPKDDFLDVSTTNKITTTTEEET